MNPRAEQHYQDWDLFALGVLDDAEMRAMAAHLASGCEVCARLSQSAHAFVAGMATLAPEVPMSPGAEDRLRRRLKGEAAVIPISTGPQPRKLRPRIWAFAPWLLAAACAFIAFGLAIALRHARTELDQARRGEALSQAAQIRAGKSAMPNGQPPLTAPDQGRIAALQHEIDALRAEKASADQALKTTQDQLIRAQLRTHALETSLRQAQLQVALYEKEKSARPAFNDRMIALLQSAPLSQLDLKPAHGADASARVFWKDDSGLLLVARELPPLQPDGSFQLWFYQKGTGKPVNVGQVQVDRSGGGLLFVPPGPALSSMAGALLTAESGSAIAANPGREILRVGP
jgi:hypothetical protein